MARFRFPLIPFLLGLLPFGATAVDARAAQAPAGRAQASQVGGNPGPNQVGVNPGRNPGQANPGNPGPNQVGANPGRANPGNPGPNQVGVNPGDPDPTQVEVNPGDPDPTQVEVNPGDPDPSRAPANPGPNQVGVNQVGARSAPVGAASIEATDVPSLQPAPALGGLVGKPIVRIDVVAQGDRWQTVAPVTSVELGEPLSADAARRAMRELLASGNFARAFAEASLLPDGAALRIVVVPRRRIATVQITGGALDRQDTLRAAGVAEGGEITAAGLAEIGPRVRAFYAEHGYPAAAVAVRVVDTDDPTQIVVAVDVEAGAPRLVSQRVFVVDPRAARELGSLKESYPLGVGARVDEPALAEADREMAELLRRSGFHYAQVSHRVLSVGPNNYLYVYLQPGARIVPAFDGNRAFDDDTLEDALGLGETTDTKPNDLADRLRAFYVTRGFLDAEITPSLGGKPDDPVRYLTFTVREGEQVRVTKRVFPCLTGDLSADDLGREIESFLEEDLPGNDFTLPDPRGVADLFGPTRGAGGRARLVELIPAMTYAPETYDRALKHLRDLYFSKGYLNAVVGPVSVLRATCSRRSPPGVCVPEPVAERVTAQCRTDALGLPLPEPPVPAALTCRPDPARHVTCAPEVTLRIPVHPGPQTVLYDVAFEGNKGFCAQTGLGERDRTFCAEERPFSERWLSDIAALELGKPLSTLALDAARLRILDAYRDLGYAFAEVRAAIEPSPDRTRARARFIVSERDRVFVTGIVVKGAVRTDEQLILRRVLLREGAPFRQSQARLSEERIATLGPFSSVSISLEDPDVPQKNKRVVIHVVEQLPQYLNPQIGFSTGEGARLAFEYGHRNIGGLAIGLTMRVQLSYLFEFMIVDDAARRHYEQLEGDERLERRNTISVTLPDIGLGPLVSLSLSGIEMRDNQLDFGFAKQALIPALTYRPRRTVTAQLAVSTELNNVGFFQSDSGADPGEAASNKRDILDQLRMPEGRTIALAQRLDASWDTRDVPFAATRGFLLSGGIEHVDAFDVFDAGESQSSFPESHFLRFTGRVSGYIPLARRGPVLALSLSGGYIHPLVAESGTYPDRLFFLGGVDSLRSHLAESLYPEDGLEEARKALGEGTQISTDDIPRGGTVMVNPRAELRVPLTDLLQLGFFLDAGNLWIRARNVNLDPRRLRYGLGAGLRVNTPIGPLAFDYGFNLDPREELNEIDGALHFSVGLF
ncbi:POTRA domain-containing protein [Sorangium sp. So ce1024]|uniref:POTRA domain-containing protein n=1 Tax=Sorangium sp. So ce1024 TaxID=3133327 RepID=UPI003F05447F